MKIRFYNNPFHILKLKFITKVQIFQKSRDIKNWRKIILKTRINFLQPKHFPQQTIILRRKKLMKTEGTFFKKYCPVFKLKFITEIKEFKKSSVKPFKMQILFKNFTLDQFLTHLEYIWISVPQIANLIPLILYSKNKNVKRTISLKSLTRSQVTNLCNTKEKKGPNLLKRNFQNTRHAHKRWIIAKK